MYVGADGLDYTALRWNPAEPRWGMNANGDE